jgi:ABC-type sugar transport system substrate-binding protein
MKRKWLLALGAMSALIVSAALTATQATGSNAGARGTYPGVYPSGKYGETYNPPVAIINKALISPADLPTDPAARNIVLAALARAAKPVNEALALKCWKDNVCDTGTGGKMVVGEADGFCGNVWRQVLHMEYVLQALTYPQIGKIIYTCANLNTEKAISDFRSILAQHANVMIGYADAGAALLPSIRDATKQGVPYVTYANGPIGKPGIDYLTVTGPDQCKIGVAFATVLNKATPAGALIGTMGGTPGNPITPTWQGCMKNALTQGRHLTPSLDTNWSRAGVLQAASADLSKYPNIAGWAYDSADPSVGLLRAYQLAHKPTNFTLATETDEQSLFCAANALHNPNLHIWHFSALNSQGRMALTAGMMKLAGAPIPPHIVIGSSLTEAKPSDCNPALPATASQTTTVPVSLLKKMFPK